MRPQSAKAKGRRLQQEIVEAIYKTFPDLLPGDVEWTSMGASGVDVKLSPAARLRFPFAVEAKNVEAINIWKAIEQAQKHAEKTGLEPMVVFRKNNTPTFVAISFPRLLQLLSGNTQA